MIELSPGLSWLVVGGLAGFGVTVYLLASTRLDRQERDLDESRTFTEPADPNLRVFGGVYDHQARGDFALVEDDVQRLYEERMRHFHEDEWKGYP